MGGLQHVYSVDGHMPEGFYDAAGNKIESDLDFPEKYEQEIDILNCELGGSGKRKYFITGTLNMY
jgi:hypothetical protein